MAGSVIVAGARTPMGRLLGSLKDFSGADLGGFAIKAALERAGISPDDVDYVFMGHVIQAGTGQITARQAAANAGIPLSVPATTVNKVCLSGLNSIYLADQMIQSGDAEIVFDNIGAQPHHLIASPIKGDATAEEVEKAFKAEKGPPPLEEKGTKSTAVLEGGEGQLVTLDLEPGRYALYCFITDREGGPPHVFKGMVEEVEVE